MGSIAFVGMDVHKATIAVAVAEGGRGGEVRQLGDLPEPRRGHRQAGGTAGRAMGGS